MPALGSYDELAHTFCEKEDIEQERGRQESLIPTSRGLLQFDTLSRQRMMDALTTLVPEDVNSVVFWKMGDNTSVPLRHVQLKDLIEEASKLASARTVQMFTIAHEFKNKLAAGHKLTLRDISADKWQ